MVQESNFFDEIRDWSERKLNILRKYLESSTKILGSIDQVYYVDGFAGRGYYGLPDEQLVAGSPIQAAQLAQQYKKDGRSYALQCINIEINKETFDGLQEATKPYKDVVTNLYGSFVDNIDTVLNIVEDKPVVCFLDPFGVDGMDMIAIQKLLSRRGITDFWIRFEVGEVRRRDGWFNKSDPGAEKQFDILCRVYGVFDRNKLHRLLDDTTPELRKTRAIQLYLEQISNMFRDNKGDGFAETYRIGSLEGSNKYDLVFASAGKKGFTLASNIVYGIEENYQREVEWYRLKNTGQMTMFSIIDPTGDEIFEAKVQAIQHEILNTYRNKVASRIDIHTQLLMNGWFGSIKGPHLTSALKNLCKNYKGQANGQISDDYTMFTFK